MLRKCSEGEGNLIWKASKSWHLQVKYFYSSLELDRGVSFPSKVA